MSGLSLKFLDALTRYKLKFKWLEGEIDMKILYYDCFCRISGDMNLAALIDLGVPKEYLMQELSKMNLNSEYEL